MSRGRDPGGPATACPWQRIAPLPSSPCLPESACCRALRLSAFRKIRLTLWPTTWLSLWPSVWLSFWLTAWLSLWPMIQADGHAWSHWNGDAARIHALVVGIDAYASQGGELEDLHGAVNDARDIAAALEEAGAATVTVLLDRQAHREAIFQAWEGLKARAAPGDMLLVTFAGHGAQEPERFPGTESDGMDEVMVLGGFRSTAPHNAQRIIDHEWRALVAEAGEYAVVLVFDACHSGTMNRSLARGRMRFAHYGPIHEDQLLRIRPGKTEHGGPGALEHEVYVGATRDDLLVQEILYNGEFRGALSLYFAKALRGAADLDRDGTITRGELRRYIDANVGQITERRQFPTVLYAGSDHAPLLRSSGCEAQPEIPEALPLAMDGLTAQEQAELFARLRHVQRAEADKAVLTLDARRRVVRSIHGDEVARLSSGMAADELQGVVDKWRILPALQALNHCRPPLGLRILQGDGLHRAGDQVTLAVEPRTWPYLVMVNLPSTGKVEYLYPSAPHGDPLQVDPRRPYEIAFRVQPPFGGDHLLVLAARDEPRDLYQALQRLDGRMAAGDVYQTLRKALEQGGNTFELGVLGLYTAP